MDASAASNTSVGINGAHLLYVDVFELRRTFLPRFCVRQCVDFTFHRPAVFVHELESVTSDEMTEFVNHNFEILDRNPNPNESGNQKQATATFLWREFHLSDSDRR